MKPGSLTPKGLRFLRLSPGDLKNGYFALFCRNCRCAPNLYLAQRYSLFWATIGHCPENAVALPERRLLVAIFLTDNICVSAHSCDDDDNEHVLLSKIARLVIWRLSTAWCWPPSSPRSRASCFTTCLCGAGWGYSMYLVRAPYDPYDCNCLNVRCARGQTYTLGHLTAPVASLLSLLMHDVSVAVFRATCVRSKVDVTSHERCDVTL